MITTSMLITSSSGTRCPLVHVAGGLATQRGGFGAVAPEEIAGARVW
jgi:hypothetical protein